MSSTNGTPFDDQVTVSREPIDPPQDQSADEARATNTADQVNAARKVAALLRLADRALPGLSIPDEALRRENLYEQSE